MQAPIINWDTTMKKTLLVAAAALGALFAGSAAMAQDSGSLSYNVAVTNNYVWRGVSQTNGKEALQGGLDYKKGVFYAGTWLSNVSFDAPKSGEHADTEMDLYLGLTPSVGDFAFDFGAIAYTYPQAGSANIGELKAGVSHPMGKGTIGAVMYVPTETLDNPYYEVNASYPLTDKLSISGALANNEANKVEIDGNMNGDYGVKYTTWNAGLTYALTSAVSLDLRYSQAEHMPNYTYVTLKAGF